MGGLFGAGVYLMMRRSIVKLIIGLGLVGHAGNLLVFATSRVVRARPPIVEEGSQGLTQPHADPLPQALILTAIVIGFSVLAFMMVLASRVYKALGTDDTDTYMSTELGLGMASKGASESGSKAAPEKGR